MTHVYILQSVANPERFYVGLSATPDARIATHNEGGVFHTSKWRPWRVTVSIAFASRQRAVEFERYLKSGSGRAFIKRHFSVAE
jgi:predicted GIY-YIG superfamily endonuclease